MPWLTRRLRVPSPDPASDALARATLLEQASQAGLARLDELNPDDPHGVGEAIRVRVEQRTFAAWERLGTRADVESPSDLYARLRVAMIEAERARVLEIRSEGQVPSEVVREVLGMLDIEESMVDAGSQDRASIRSAAADVVGADTCADLDAFPACSTQDEPTCPDCLAEGTEWVALRQCLTCGNIGCCDSSVGRHATAHFHATTHPVMQSAEPGESWRWCYVHLTTG